jgi:hypothetical protein
VTDKERLRRYETIVKWGKEYVDYMKAAGLVERDKQLLDEYMRACTELKERCTTQAKTSRTRSK